MKKIFAVMLMVIFASFGVLTGCDLITLNEYKYYTQTVIKVGDIEIDKETLIRRYNSIGAQYVEDGYSIETAMQITIDSIINRELVLMEAKKVITFTQNDINDILQEVYDSVNETLLEYEGQIKAEWNVTYLASEETEEEEDEATTYDVYEPYEREIEFVDGVFQVVQEEEEELEEPIGDFVRENNDGDVDWAATGKTYEELQEEAWNRYIRALKNDESWKNLSIDEDEVFERELDRLYEIFEGNKYIELLEEYFYNNMDVNSVDFRNQIKQKYIELVQDSFAKYSIDMDAYHEAMGSDSSSVYYHPNSGEEYVYVSHILIKYSDEQNELLEEYQAQLDEGTITQTEYEDLVEEVKLQIAGYARDEEGNEVGEEILASDILTEIENALNAYGTSEDDLTISEKSKIFNDFIYEYNQDDGMMNAETPYVVNLDTEVEDKMVEAFANASRALYEEGKGSLSELVYTDYGAHIIFYSKPVENIVNYDSLSTVTPEALYDTPINLYGDKNMYDKMYELITAYSYDNYQEGIINEYKSEIKVTLYKSNYKDLLG